MCWQLCVCIHLSHLFKFSSTPGATFARQMQTNCKTERGCRWWHHSSGCEARMEWWPACARLRVFTSDCVSLVVAVPVKELLWPHFCFITPNLPLNIHTGVCELTYGVIVRCQWSLVRIAPTWKHSVEHSEPLMVSSGTWHQHCLVSRHFSFFFSFSLRSLALLELSPVLEPTIQMGGKQVSRLCQLFFSKVQQNGK